MRALMFNQSRAVELSEEPEPAPGPGEAVIEVAYAGICGSDLHGIRPGGYRTPPLIMGHEVSGVTGDGRRVAVNATLSCGACDLCADGYEQICRHRAIVGIDRPGGLTQRLAVPESALVEIPSDAPLAAGALVEPLAVGLRAWRRSGAGDGSRVGILGAGNIGLMILTIGATTGADLTVADLQPHRQEAAREAGASTVASALEGEFDVIFDAVGAPETHAASVDLLRSGGTAVWLGCLSAEAGFDSLAFVRQERNLLASFAYTRADFAEAVALTSRLTFPWVEAFPLDEGAALFMDMAAGRSPVIKALIHP